MGTVEGDGQGMSPWESDIEQMSAGCESHRDGRGQQLGLDTSAAQILRQEHAGVLEDSREAVLLEEVTRESSEMSQSVRAQVALNL